MDKKYQPLEIEERLSKHWAETPFKSQKISQPCSGNSSSKCNRDPAYGPTVFNMQLWTSIQDITSFNDKNVFWQMGTDHAGIASTSC